MAVNVKLLRKVRKLIAEEPRRLQMGVWGKQTKAKVGPPCGTVACLAGWTVLAAIPKRQWSALFKRRPHQASEDAFVVAHDYRVPERAAELLGIPYRDCPFFNTSWRAKHVLAWIDRQLDAAQKS